MFPPLVFVMVPTIVNDPLVPVSVAVDIVRLVVLPEAPAVAVVNALSATEAAAVPVPAISVSADTAVLALSDREVPPVSLMLGLAAVLRMLAWTKPAQPAVQRFVR